MIWGAVLKTIIMYTIVVVAMRLMGKRQIGQLQPFEFAVTIMISELAVFPMTEKEVSLVDGIIPIIVLVACQFLISIVSVKSIKAREIICGRPKILISNGALQENNLRKELYTINDLLEQLRISNVQNVNDVEHAVLETNGQLSLVLKSQKRPVTPSDLGIETEYEGLILDIIVDGVIHYENLKLAKVDESWLYNKLEEKGWPNPEDIFYASLDTQGNFYFQPKLKAAKNRVVERQ
ncbi:MAG: DUF421 domain-containing protein [Clostridiaceae bacterium]|jgi:uncharacterized membrane protein YcaP (DUF421 family)|nr:DUF421 domain-containing protein [Clostridiaceae bacterium]